MHVFNADGSVAEMCGNGLRCVVRHYLAGRSADHVVVDTDGGLLDGWGRDDGTVRVSMGEAALIEPRVDATAPDVVFHGTAVSLGNPHLVLDRFSPDTDLMMKAAQYGPLFERHPMFPERVNVGFVAVDREQLRLVVFERGAGITQACGTGASAAAAVALSRGWVTDVAGSRAVAGRRSVCRRRRRSGWPTKSRRRAGQDHGKRRCAPGIRRGDRR